MPDTRYVDTTAVAFRSTRANRLMESKREEAVGRPVGSRSRGQQAHIRYTSTSARCVATASPSGLMAWPSTSGIVPPSLPATRRCPVGPQYLGCARGQRDTITESACLLKLTCDSQPCSCLRPPGPHGWPWPEAPGAFWPGSPARQHGSPHVYEGACASLSLVWRQIPALAAVGARRGQRVETMRCYGAVIPSTLCGPHSSCGRR